MAWFSLKNHPAAQLIRTAQQGLHAKEREKDMREYWPLCLASSLGDIKNARYAFYWYAFNKPAWRSKYASEYMLRLHIADMKPEGFVRGSAVRGVDDQF